jgi:hypothetical protein
MAQGFGVPAWVKAAYAINVPAHHTWSRVDRLLDDPRFEPRDQLPAAATPEITSPLQASIGTVRGIVLVWRHGPAVSARGLAGTHRS